MAKQSRWLADANDLKRRRKRQAAARRTPLHSAEPLEARLALAVSTFEYRDIENPDNWVVITGDNGDDIFMQRVATGEVDAPDQQDLLVANNSSFLNNGPGTFREVDDIDSFGTIYVTNGTRVSVTGVRHDQLPLTSLPVGQTALPTPSTTFVLSRPQAELTEAIFGTVSYGNNVWTFTNGVLPGSTPPSGNYPGGLVFTFTGPGYPAPGAGVPPAVPVRPIGIGVGPAAAATGDATATVTWSSLPVELPGTLAPLPVLTITYDTNLAQRVVSVNPVTGAFFYQPTNQNFFTEPVPLLPSAGPIATFTLPVTNVYPGGIVDGTLSGGIDVTADGVADFVFRPQQLFPANGDYTSLRPLVFNGNLTGTFTIGGDAREIEGFYDPRTGIITFQFFDPAPPIRVPQALPGLVTIVSATYATYNQDQQPMSATFFAGLDIHNQIIVELQGSGSTINVESPIIHIPFDQVAVEGTLLGTSADIVLRATNVNVKATMSAFDEIRINGVRPELFPEIAQARAYAVVGANAFLPDGVTPDPTFGTITNIVIPPGGGGLGYSPFVPVTVWIAPPPGVGPGFVQATATAVLDANGSVVGFTIVNPGAGYTPGTSPQVSISPPPAQPPVPVGPTTFVTLPAALATAYAVIGSDPALPNFGQLIDLIVPPGRGGIGYNPAVMPVTVTIAPPPGGGIPATATATVVGGVVTGFTITNPGSGYLPSPSSPPQVTISPPPLTANVVPAFAGNAQGFAAINQALGTVIAIAVPPGLGGQGYDPVNPPTVWINPPVGFPGAGLVQATATAVVQNGVVVAINIITPGAGYTTIPAVTIAPPPDLPPIGPGFLDPVTGLLPVPGPTGVAPVAEQVLVDAAVAAQFFDIRVGNDLNTAGITRGRLFVSPSGSFSSAIPPSPVQVTSRAQAVFVQADDADVIVEGRIVADEHTYLIQSRQAADADPTDGLEPAHTPYLFTTRSPVTGANTGLIAGGTIAVTLGNDTPSPEVGAAALNTVDLSTDVDSVRVKAATRAGEPLTGPFPYDLTIAEFDSLSIDAVAASGRPIVLSAGQDMRFNAALATGSDLRLNAQGAFTLTAPVSALRGQIDVVAESITVNNSLRVLDPVPDPARDDITLRATGGDISLTGLVSAVNNVNLIQANSLGLRPYNTFPIGGMPIPDNSVNLQPLTITDDYGFSDINVVVNIEHTFINDLGIELIAPNGTVVNLMNKNSVNAGINGATNLTNTIFDSEAAGPISNGVQPYTGSFTPVQPLTPLYGGRTAGTWQLRVTDFFGRDTGRLLSFGLQFKIDGPNYGTVGGASRVVAERLNVTSEGIVSLFTNVDRLEGVAAIGFTVNEQDDIAITSLRSGGLVSLRAAGTDVGIENRYTDNAIALTANLIDVTNLDVSTPAGSMEIFANTAQTLVLGRARAIASGLADPMQAAGNVTIRSKIGDVDVLDAPLGGMPAAAVRVATTAALPAVYAQNVPGTRSSTLTATGPGSLNGLNLGGVAGIDGVNTLLVGDRVLVRNQPSVVQGGVTYYPNGIYIITSLGSGTTPWVLTRASNADTTIEVPAGTRLFVQDGTQAGRVFDLASYADVLGVVPIVASVVPNRPDAILARAATTGSLWGTYANAAGSITGIANGALPLVDGVALRVGDRVLVRQGTHTTVDPRTLLPVNTTQVSNGVYEVFDVGSGTSRWVLQRIADMDGLVTVAPAVQATRTGAATVVVDPTVDPTVFASLQVGMYVRGTGINPGATIVAINSATRALTLTAGSVVGTGATVIGVSQLPPTGLVVSELLGYVNVREGSLGTPSIGGAYRVAFDSLGLSLMTIADVTGLSVTEIGSDNLSSLVRFVVSSNAGSNRGAGTLGKMIDLRQFNTAARLVDGVRYGNQDMDFRFSTLVTAPIQLSQQLPAIASPFLIDGGRRYTPAGTTAGTTSRVLVDGSRISRDRFGRTLFQGTLSVTRTGVSTIVVPAAYSQFANIREGMLVAGSAIRQGTRIVSINRVTRTLTLTPNAVVGTGITSVTIASEVNGFDFGSGSSAVNVGVDADLDGVPDDYDGIPGPDLVIRQPGAVLANVNVGGFGNGAAVTIDGADGVVIRNSIIGQAVDGSRLSSRYGVLVRGAASSATLLNNQIMGHSGAGIRIQDTAGRVAMVGNIIGSLQLPNEVGVEITSTATNGNGNRVGVDPILPNRALVAVTVTRAAATHSITLPANYAGLADLFVGLGVQGAGVAAGARIRAINTTTRVVSLTLDGVTAGGVASNGSGSVSFGNFVSTVRDASTIVLPVGVNLQNLYVGQGIIGTGIRGGTTIAAIDLVTRTITLSNPLLATANGVAVTFTAPGRNQIAFNRYGLLLAAGGNTVTNSDIFSNTFDGVRITGGVQTIGTSTKASSKSNAIFSNGGWGVNIKTTLPLPVDQQNLVNATTVQGNYIGTRAPGSARLRNVLGNISVRPADGRWTPIGNTNVDPQGNVYGPQPSTGGSRPPSVPFPL